MRVGLLGAKLGHSLSPEIHQLIFEQLGIQGTYDLIEVPAEKLVAKVTELQADYTGLNVTIPHKVGVMPLMEELSPEAKKIGAVNTIHFQQGHRSGYNTDYFGFGRLLAQQQIALAERRVLVLGTGGASRAVTQYLLDQGVAVLYQATRSLATAPADIQKAAAAPRSRRKLLTYEELKDLAVLDLLVNCTPVGMYPKTGVSPVPETVVRQCEAVIDIIYNPAETELLRLARQDHKKAANGMFMLVAQAVASEEIWLGRKLDSELITKIAARMEEELS